ncbi:MAG: SpoIIE family protein phosphatase [Bacteroidia bacterium]|nr:SpoIIE family protein phosphatase [Bacteroidia bacterium]
MRVTAMLLSLLCLAVSCSTDPNTQTISWNKQVDSLLHDTMPVHAYAAQYRREVLEATTDTAAVRAMAGMAEFLPAAAISMAADEAAAHCPKNNEALLADIRCKQGIGLFRRQKNDSAARLFRESLRLSRKLKSTALETQALCWLGDYYRLSYKFDSCEATLNEAIRLAQPAGLYLRVAHAQGFIGDLYRIQDNQDTARFIYRKAMQNARKANDNARLSFLLANMGEAYRLEVNYDSAKFYLDSSLAVATQLNDNGRKAFALSNLGDLARLEGKNPQALTYYHQAIDAAKLSGEKRRINYCLVNLSELYASQSKFDLALQMATDAYGRASAQGEKTIMTSSLHSCGEIHRRRKNFMAADTCYRKAVAIAQSINNRMREIVGILALADMYADAQNYDSALVYAQKGKLLAEEIEDPNNLADAERILSAIYFSKKQYPEAIRWGESSLQRAQQLNLTWIVQGAAVVLDSAYRRTGNYPKAYASLKVSIAARDSLEGREQYQRLAAAEYNTREAELKAGQARKESKLEADKARQQQQIDRQRFLIWIAVGGALLLGGLLFVALRAYRAKQRSNIIIAQQKQQVEQQKLLVEEKNREVMDSIHYARRLQEAILPDTTHIAAILPQSFVFYLPKDVVAGDFYFFVEKDNHLFLAAADCTGHGVPGALVSVVCSNALKRAVNEFGLTDPGQILDQTTSLVLETFAQSHNQVNDGMDISLLVINRHDGSFAWAGANRPLWIVSHGSITQIKGDSQPVGFHEHARLFTTHHRKPESGTMLYLFSDGYADQFGGEAGKKFKTSRFQELIIRIAPQAPNEQKEVIAQEFSSWKQQYDQVDDVCVIGLRW